MSWRAFKSCVIGMLKDWLCILPLLAAFPIFAQGTCGDVQLQLAPDYSFAIGSSSGGSSYSFALGGQTLAQGPMTQLALFHFDNSFNSTSGVSPAQSSGTSFVPGKFGSAVVAAPSGTLTYPAAENLSLSEGTIEMWVAPLYDGNNPIYTAANQPLFFYDWGSPGNHLVLAAAGGSTYLYAGAPNNIYAGNLNVSGFGAWQEGQWHHLAFTYSVSQSRIRIYVDGVLAQEVDAALDFPSAGPATFSLGGDGNGNGSAFAIDEVRISNDEMTPAEIAYDATRSTPFADNEVYLSLAGVATGQLSYAVNSCGTASLTYLGIPIKNFSPPSGLLPAGGNSVAVSFQTISPTVCRYSVGTNGGYNSMQPLDTGPASTMHQGSIGISADTRVLSSVYISCASNPDFVQSAVYRPVAAPSGAFPRIGSIWGGEYIYRTNPAQAEKLQLFQAASLTPAEASAIRAANADVLILVPISADDTVDYSLPETYYLHDTKGNRIADWCSPVDYLLNMTRPEVSAYVGQQAYQKLAQSNWAFDGMFFDEFTTSLQVSSADCYGNPIQISSQNNGMPDDQTAFSAAWAAGEYLAVSTYRQLVPGGYVSGHVADDQPASLAAFNGPSIVFDVPDVREQLLPFATLWDLYQTWETAGVPPAMTMVQSSPPNQLSYGYGYNPLTALLPSTAGFGQTFYPNMRFGLGLALMNNGFFTYDFGDNSAVYSIAWWYDEYGFSLGYPIAPAAQVAAQSSPNLLTNSGFEAGLSGWQFIVDNDGQAQATVAVDDAIAAEGNSSAHIQIIEPGTINWHIDLEQDNIALTAGKEYQVQFWARADPPRTITVFSQGGAPNYPNYGLDAQISIGTSWSLYTASSIATTTANDGRLEFWVGDVAGDVWLDGVALSAAPPQVYRRDFSNGVVLLNGESNSQNVTLESGFQRFQGTQAPRYQYIVDDSDSAFSSVGSWNTVTYNTGAFEPGFGPNLPSEPQNQNGPYYHCWEGTCHELDSGTGQAQWNLNLPADGQYTIQAWLPAAPNAANCTKNAIYEVVAGGNVVASVTIDQTTAAAGDAWHMVATVSLTSADAPFVRVHNGGSGALIADAVYLTSAALYNDGSPAPQVTLGAFDAILLQRQQPAPVPASQVNSVINAASYQPGIASGGFVSIIGTGFESAPARSWSSSDFSGNNLPTSLNGISVTINSKPAYVEFISSTQINAIAPDDDAIGQVQVQVTTPQGASYAGTFLKQRLSPALFTYPSGTTSYVAAVHTDGTLVGPNGPSSRPAVPGEVIEIYGTGFGPTTPATPTSQLVAQPAPTAASVTVSIGGTNAAVQWAGIVSPGLYQLNVQVPNVGAGDQPVQTSVAGFQGAANVFVAVIGGE